MNGYCTSLFGPKTEVLYPFTRV
ncbi:MAG: hypothetical protein QOG99_1587, partial [Frankiales bacterium]|nr:hypothetical protein [Frankiales bacterium]